MFRSEILNKYIKDVSIENILKWNVGDTPLWLYIAKFSKIKVMKDITAVYRVRPNSACHFETPKERFDFRKKGFEIPFYFIEKFGARKKTVDLLNAKYFRNELIYFSETGKFQEAKSAFQNIRKLKLLKIKDYILLFASINIVTKKLSALFLTSITKIRQ